MTTVSTSHVLPTPIETTLWQIRRRALGLAVCRGAAISIGTLLLAMTLAMIVDWSWGVHQISIRVGLTLTALVGTAWLSLWVASPAVRRAWQRQQAASGAEMVWPQLEERWTTIVCLAETSRRPIDPVTQAMQRQVASEALAIGRQVRPARVASPAALQPAGLFLLLSLGIFGGFLAIDSAQTSILLRRFWSPFSTITATRWHQVTGDLAVPRGEKVTLALNITGVLRSTAELQIDRGAGIETRRLRTITDDPTAFQQRLPVDGTFRYRWLVGDTRTAWYEVRALEYPALAELEFVIIPPEYSQRPRVQRSTLPPRMSALQGSQLLVRMRPLSPLQRLDLIMTPTVKTEPPAPSQSATLTPDRTGWYSTEMVLMQPLTLEFQLLSPDGLSYPERLVSHVEVLIDQTPVVHLHAKSDETVAAADDIIEIPFEAHDDLGIVAAELVVTTENEDGTPGKILSIQRIPLGDQQGARHVRGKVRLDLQSLGLKAGESISYTVRVADTRLATSDETPLTPETATSAELSRAEDADSRIASDTAQSESMKSTTSGDSDGKPGNRMENSLTAESTGLPAENDDREGHAANVYDGPVSALRPLNRDHQSQGLADRDESDGPVSALDPWNVYTVDSIASESTERTLGQNDGRGSNSPMPGSEQALADDFGNPASANPRNSPNFPQNPSQPGSPSPPETNQDAASRLVERASPWSDAQSKSPTDRRRIRITERIEAVAESPDLRPTRTDLRERLSHLLKVVTEIEQQLTKLVQNEVPESNRSELAKLIDTRLGDVETSIATFQHDVSDGPFAFVGLQLVDLGRSSFSPARERTFLAIRDPRAGVDAPSGEALQHVTRGRELLAALVQRYEAAAREKQLAQSLEETAKMFLVYVEKSQDLLREARSNRHPLERKMAVLEFDQEYLDRLTEVLKLRRDLMAELGRTLADDPRLLSRYLEFLKRRRNSYRERFAELTERQTVLASEVHSWVSIPDDRRDDLWTLIAELRLQAATPLAKDASELAEHVEKQFPLAIEPTQGAAMKVLELSRQVASGARATALEARRQIQQPAQTLDLVSRTSSLAALLSDLDAALEQLRFEHPTVTEIEDYVTARLAETRSVADQADAWSQTVTAWQRRDYHALVETDQDQLALLTETLRGELLSLEGDLATNLQQVGGGDLPQSVKDRIRELQQFLQTIVHRQIAATYACSTAQMKEADRLLTQLVADFTRGVELFDQLRREFAAVLDEVQPPDPDASQLVDPTLDDLLAQLEREPNLAAQLGLPDRPQNLRVVVESMTWQEAGVGLMADASRSAAARVQSMPPSDRLKPAGASLSEAEPTPAERAQRERAREMEARMAKTLTALQDKAKDTQTPLRERSAAEERARALKQRMQGAMRAEDVIAAWNRLADVAQSAEAARALADGVFLPDDQWNKVLSTLDDGLWQVGGRQPPEEYRSAIERYQARLRHFIAPPAEAAP